MTVKQKKFVAGIVAGKPKYKAYQDAGYKASTNMIARSESSKLTTKPHIQAAIDEALVKQGADADFAVQKIVNVANMEIDNKSAPSVLKASETILKLHGWNEKDKPVMQMQINQFFAPNRSGESTTFS